MTRVKIFGVSHSRYFELNNEVRNSLLLDKEVDVEVVKIKAASIKGFGNRESTLGVSSKIEASMSKDDNL